MIDAKYQWILDPDTAAKIGKVGVLYGGLSEEREVSLWSGKAVYDALITAGVDALLIDVDENFLALVVDKPFDFAFIMLHGRGGEDGTIQAILDWLGIPYTGSGVRASAIAMDKIRSKQLWDANRLPVLPHVILEEGFDCDKVIDYVGLPLVVKPALEGSSNGISKVESREQLASAYEKAAQYHTVVMAETWAQGDEFTAAIIGDKALPLIRIKVKDGLYDFETKYITGADEYQCPCGLTDNQEAAVQSLAVAAAEVVGISDWCRVDLIIDANGDTWFIEVNTIPGMTPTSLVPKAAKEIGWSFEETVLAILKAAWENENA